MDPKAFEVVFVYETPEGGCAPRQCIDDSPLVPSVSKTAAPPSASTPVVGASYPSDAPRLDDPIYIDPGPAHVLKPAVHWEWDTAPATNVIPLPVGSGSPFYFGLGDPTASHYFAFLTYYFTTPSVNLDHSDHVSSVVASSTGYTVSFLTTEAFNYAKSHWKIDIDLIVMAYTPGCPGYEVDERCYLRASNVQFMADLTVVISGEFCHSQDIISKGETEWGWYTPKTGGNSSTPYGSNVNWNGTSTSYNSTSNNSTSNNSTDTAGRTNFGTVISNCTAPPDTTYGLPTACFGGNFDEDLDDQIGYEEDLPEAYQRYLTELGGDDLEDNEYPADMNDPDVVKKVAKVVVDTVKKATTIHASINKSISFRLPDPAKPASRKLQNKEARQAVSPWGDAILLKSITNKGKTGYMNVYCVGCGVSGGASIAGKAAWSPVGGVSEGYADFKANIDFVFQLGIDAQISYEKNWESTLLRIGLPGLSWGSLVSIGPSVALGTRVTLETQAEGQLLAGAKFGIKEGHTHADFVNPDKSFKNGWDPYFTPVFNASGKIELAATLGLPVSVELGITIAKWTKALRVIDEPSIKATAQVAASIGLQSNNKLKGGFTTIDGCKGIATEISWRNRLWIDVLGLKTLELHDTKDKSLGRNCIKLPGATQRSISAPAFPFELSPRAFNDTQSDDELVDVTKFVVDNFNDTVTYNVPDIPMYPYIGVNGYRYDLFTVPDKSLYLATCGEGDVYAIDGHITGDDDTCAGLWAFVNGTVIGDGAHRIIHFYDQALRATGVSRLRVSSEKNMPRDGVLISFQRYNSTLAGDEDQSNDGLYFGVDSTGQVLYSIACVYNDDTTPKIFLAKDPVEGANILQSSAVQHSITGGVVNKCFYLPLVANPVDQITSYTGYADAKSMPLQLTGSTTP
ncbi:hypothetical protein GQ53DRAFT_637385 [Thozetella sp. PMI_491]|nr:hypothetical protein GQ53DRAFT_637385 [Thozetella sp. PMI_491]